MNTSNTVKIDQIIQFALATAGQENFGYKELGPIHLIKYIYLADLEYAQNNNGETYTGLPWKFHHFGPWSYEAFARIEPALEAIGAEKRIIPMENCDYADQITRWSISNDDIYNNLERQLDIIITTSIQKNVFKFNSDTESLLHYVYKTLPMLNAKPGDFLDFSVFGNLEMKSIQHVNILNVNRLSCKQRKKKRDSIKALKIEFKKKLENKKQKVKLKFDPPPYDDIFFKGLDALNSLAGEEITSIKGIASFSDDIWKSKARFDPDVP